MSEQLKSGNVEGTGAAINIEIGWKPDYVKVINVEDGDAIWEWFTGMANGTATKTSAAVAPLAANGITPFDGDINTGPGFTIGTDISESGKTLSYFVSRNER